MALKSSFFNSINGDRRYDARVFAEYFASFIGNGVFPNPSSNLQVVEGGNMKTIVRSGKAWINGYFLINDTDYVLTHDNADGVLKRIDRIILRLNYVARQIEIVIKKGTFASSPTAPTLQRDNDMYELAIADVLINNGATQITQANITDTRLNNSLCGVVHGVVNQVDTTTIFNQYEGWFDEFSVDKEQEIQQFIDDLNALLDGDVASNLLSRLVSLENAFNTHKGESATLTAKGHVQLSNAINSTSQTLAATPYAVKQAYDLAQSAKTDGNNVKANTVSALLSVDNSLPITSSSTWTDIVTQIGNISSGKKWASGTVTASSGTVTVSGLSFKPKTIIVSHYQTADNAIRRITVYSEETSKSGTGDFLMPYTIVTNTTPAVDIIKIDGSTYYINETGFRLKTNAISTCAWIAFE